METKYSEFVMRTAKDYDMDPEIVREENKKFGSSLEFYASLEEILKDNSETVDQT